MPPLLNKLLFFGCFRVFSAINHNRQSIIIYCFAVINNRFSNTNHFEHKNHHDQLNGPVFSQKSQSATSLALYGEEKKCSGCCDIRHQLSQMRHEMQSGVTRTTSFLCAAIDTLQLWSDECTTPG